MELKPGCKLTEVGVIPEDWTVKNLGALGEPLIGLTYDPGNVKPEGLLVLRSSNVSDGALQFDDNVFVDVKVPEKIIARRGDILICVRNGSRDLIGKCAMIDDRAQGMTFGAFMAVLRTPFHDYVYYQFQSELVQRQIREHLGATINQITNKSLKSFRIPFPEDDTERRAIAAALSDVDALIASLDRLIAKKRDLKQAAMQQLLTGQVRLPGFSGEWEMKRLGELAAIDPESLGSDTRADYAFKYIALEDVDSGTLRGYSELLFRAAPSRARKKLRKGDILVSTVRPNLKSHLLFKSNEENWVCSTGFAVVRCRESLTDPSFVFFHMFGDRVSRQIDALLTGSNYPAINSGDIRALEVEHPSHEEQRAIAAVLSDMDAEIAALEARRDKTRRLKQGMMQELLTGRIRLFKTENTNQ